MRQEVWFRGTRDGLLVVLEDHSSWDSLMAALAEKLEASGGFFRGAEVTVVVGQRQLGEEGRAELAALLRQYGLVPRQIREGEDLARLLPSVQPASPRRVEAHAPGAIGSAPARSAPPLVVTRTLRSGQTVRHPGDVVIVGDVNPGAEVVATGHIVVLGALRGMAHAGASGDDSAVVAAVRLEPTQLRIGRYVGRPPDADPLGAGVPEVARVANGQIVVEGRPLLGRYSPG